MKKLLSLLLAAILISFNIFFICSCTELTVPPADPDDDITEDDGSDGDGDGSTAITVPVYKDYKRDTVNFSEMTYVRPDVAAVMESFNTVTQTIKANAISPSEQVELIVALEDSYNNIYTMLTLADIGNALDSSDEFWANEYEILTTAFPAFSQSVEALLVAAAQSPHAEFFEEEYFGEGLIEEYEDGGIYSDELVALMEEEARLEASYSSISTATVTVTHKGNTDTVSALLSMYKDKYKKNTTAYLAAESECMRLYNEEKSRLSSEILVDLFKVRSRIGNEYEDGDYIDFAYDAIYHDYEPEELLAFINDVRDYVIPVYENLNSKYVFNDYKKDTEPAALTRADLINSAYSALEKTNAELADIYAYMLQHELYNINRESENRYSGAFTTYLSTYNAPFILISTSGNTTDYSTLFHEFGHFADSYINYNEDTSLDLSEVSSQALELLMLTQFDSAVTDSALLMYHTRYEMEEALVTLILQSFYALFEHFSYSIPTEEISLEALNSAVERAAGYIGLNSSVFNSVESVMIPHIFLYPTYVQSYATSITTALEIYFLETETEGEGFEVYMQLLKREDYSLSFEEHLERVGLSSPFKDDMLKTIADKIYFAMQGKHYFYESGGNSAA